MGVLKHKVDVDTVLKEHFKKTSKDLKTKDKIEFSESLVDSGEFKKVAYDVYRSVNDMYSNLWTLQDVDGRQYLIRNIDPQFEATASGDWTVASSYDKDDITLSYKNIPITRFSSNEYGYSKDDINFFKMALIERINQDSDFLKELLLEQSEKKRAALSLTFPEFSKYIKG